MTKLRYVEARFGLSALFRLPEPSWSPELLRKERACSMALQGALVTSEQLQGGSGMGCVDQSSWCVKQYGGERGQTIGMSRSVHVVVGARELNLMKIDENWRCWMRTWKTLRLRLSIFRAGKMSVLVIRIAYRLCMLSPRHLGFIIY